MMYEVLGLEPTATREQIAAAYRDRALKTHPLTVPANEQAQSMRQFIKICEAYDVLSDMHLRKVYDKHGEYSLKNGIQKGVDKFGGYASEGDHFKIFAKFFGTQNPFIGTNRSQESYEAEIQAIDKENRAEDIKVTLECELYEFVHGATKDVSYHRNIMLSDTKQSTNLI